MKKMWIAFVGVVLVAAFAAAPAGAAKGTTKIQSVQGTISGTETVFCGIDGNDNPWFSVSGNVVVNVSTLGKGTMTWGFVPQYGGDFWGFTSNNGNSGVGGPFFVNFNNPNGGANLVFTVGGGTGKFAGVSGGQLQTLPTFATVPCDNSNPPPQGVTVSVDQKIYGQLIY